MAARTDGIVKWRNCVTVNLCTVKRCAAANDKIYRPSKDKSHDSMCILRPGSEEMSSVRDAKLVPAKSEFATLRFAGADSTDPRKSATAHWRLQSGATGSAISRHSFFVRQWDGGTDIGRRGEETTREGQSGPKTIMITVRCRLSRDRTRAGRCRNRFNYAMTRTRRHSSPSSVHHR